METLKRRKENIRGQLTISDFKVVTNENDNKKEEVNKYPIKILILEKQSKETKEEGIEYNDLYDRKEVVFLDRKELFRGREKDNFKILDKVDILFVLLTKEFLYDFNLMKILMDNLDLSEGSKLKLIINDPQLRNLKTRIELYRKFKNEERDLEDSGILNVDVQKTYKVIRNISDKLDEIFVYALDKDMWTDMTLEDKLTYFLEEGGRKISCKSKKIKEEAKKENINKDTTEMDNFMKEKHYHNHFNLNIVAGEGTQQFNSANDNGSINSEQNNR